MIVRLPMIVRRLRSRVRREIVARARTVGYTPEVLCLVTGAPRSGTTAVAKWLEQHRDITAFAETRMLVAAHGALREVRRFHQLNQKADYLTESVRRMAYGFYAFECDYGGRRVLVDKEPLEPVAFPDRDYAGFLQSVRLMAPEARLLLMVRDPVSTVWSMSQRKWGYSLTDAEPHAFALVEYVDNWCACADIALALATDPNVYVCAYGQLVSEPVEESARLARFVGVQQAIPFRPKPPADPAFSPDDHALISSRTEERVAALAALGVTPL